MKKKTFVVLMLSVFLYASFLGQVTVLAVEPVPEQFRGDVPYSPDEELRQEVMEKTKRSGMLERLLAALINAVVDFAAYLLGGTSIKHVVFGQANPFSGALYGENAVGNIFTAQEWNNVINPLRLAFSSVAWIFFAISIGFYGWKMMIESTNPLKRSDWQDKMMAYIGASILLVLAHLLFFLLANLNKAFVDGLYSFARNIPLLESGFSAFSTINTDQSLTESVFLDSIIYLALAVMGLWLIILYIFRKFMIAVLVIIAPFAAWAFARNKDGMAFKLWAAELTSQIFMQTAHALVIVLYFGFLNASLGSGNMFNSVGSVLQPIMTFIFLSSAVVAAGVLLWNALRLAVSSKNPSMRYSAIKGLQYSAFGFFISIGAVLIVNILRGLWW
ncbi:hypothetical protein GCM10010965_14820 [Caldalkalibacillus thermarum]|uniref:hypothetical protein n=1 Tax=Caldalkalibacillus thermarum TaxID=296745 RepID=UPI001669A82B|nr:hypothetical protein [Caldalkalibacillus thermarum]GGK22994.1 hypothetical protein GCM10010965_14820 [Caldalkalibacillus thermarum]